MSCKKLSELKKSERECLDYLEIVKDKAKKIKGTD